MKLTNIIFGKPNIYESTKPDFNSRGYKEADKIITKLRSSLFKKLNDTELEQFRAKFAREFGLKESIDEDKPGLWANIRAKRARGEKPAHKNSQAHKDAVKAGKEINKKESVKEHKDCGCGCKGTTIGGCNTSLSEGQLNEWRAEEVLQQLGGRKFIAMTGAKNFVKDNSKKSIMFRIPKAKNGINYIRITLTPMDVYNVEFISVRGTNLKTVALEKGVYNDQLQSIFTKHTGLYTSL